MTNIKNIPILPKATAIWLIENTTLSFKQIAEFCGMHELEIQSIADCETAQGIIGENPIIGGQLTESEIERCSKDKNAVLSLNSHDNIAKIQSKTRKQHKYVPIARRQDKPDAICWLIKTYPNISDTDIIKLIGTTKQTILNIKERNHWNIKNIKPKDPVLLGLCTQTELDKIISKMNNN